MSDEIGYGKPPKHTQFKKGHSGNPNGRPKRRTVMEDLMNELSSLITINENGETRKVTRQEAMIKRLVAEAMSANMQAQKIIYSTLPKPKVIEDKPVKFKLKMGNPNIEKKAKLNYFKQEWERLDKELNENSQNEGAD